MTDREFADIIASTKGTVLSAIEKHLHPFHYHAIDDVVQETYLRAYRSLSAGRFRGDSSIGTWLYAIARNESLRMNKKLSREEDKVRRAIESMRDAEVKGTFDSCEREDMEKALKNLPERYRPVMEAVYRGISMKEIAETLNLHPGTVKSRVVRGKELLYRLMGGDA